MTPTAAFSNPRAALAGAGALLALALTGLGSSQPTISFAPDAGSLPDARASYAKLPLAFVPNRGQHDARVRYSAQGAGFGFFFTKREAMLTFSKGKRGHALALRFQGASPDVRLEATGALPGKVNYLLGRDRSQWQTNLPTFGELRYQGLWPGIDLVLRGDGRQLKYEFHLAPGAQVSDIRLAYAGASGLALAESGALRIRTRLGTLTDRAPRSFQLAAGRHTPVASRYLLHGRDGYGFALGAYDPGRALVIDPGLVYSTYLGGSDLERGMGVAVDAAGSAYLTGFTFSGDFPTTGGAFDMSRGGSFDAFATKLNAAGTALVYSTYLGGSGNDEGLGIAVDAAESAYVTGNTGSGDFPTTGAALDTSHNGGLDAFVTKLTATGSAALYSTYLGGSGDDVGFDVALDAAGSAYLTGRTDSGNFPTTGAAFDTSFNGGFSDAFVTKLNPAGTALVYSTYLGGSDTDVSRGVAVDATGNAYLTGRTDSTDFPTTAGAFDTTFNGGGDAFVTKLNPVGTAPAYSTYLGGFGLDQAFGVAVDAAGSAYVTGATGTGFPTTAGAFDTSTNGSFDAFVTKLSATGSALVYSTYLGGSDIDDGLGVAVDAAGSAHVTGNTGSGDFPTTGAAFDTSHNGGFDAFVTKMNPAGSALFYSTYFGGSDHDQPFGVAVDAAGSIYVTGFTGSGDFPTTTGAFDTTYNALDAFVTKLVVIGAPATLVLDPRIATNPVGTEHCVTATVRDAVGQPVPGVTVRFTVTGANPTGGAAVTNASGQATFCYFGLVTGLDAIRAFADTNGNMIQDPGEPSGAATKRWVEACPNGDDDDDDDGLRDENESIFSTLLGNPDSDADGVRDGNEDSDDDEEDDEDEDDDDGCPDQDSDDDGVDDEDEDD